jgi:hypothetical protein
MIGRSLALVAALAGAAHAQDDEEAGGGSVEKGAFGVGIVLGEPTGIAAKLYLGDNAVQGAVGFGFIEGGGSAHVDYVFHPWILEEREGFELIAYLGPGARLAYIDGGAGGDDHWAVGARGVIGLLFEFHEIPIDVFAEVAPVLQFRFVEGEDNGVGFGFEGGLGARYYF